MKIPPKERIKPLLRWAGGKTQLVTRLLDFVPSTVVNTRYWEPFLGGGSLFFALRPSLAYLSDANEQLIDFYMQVCSNPDLVHRYLTEVAGRNSRETYYAVREEYNRSVRSPRQAARFLYLNKHSYNGVFRVNRRGQFNVPYGERSRYVLPSREHLRAAAKALGATTLMSCSYEKALIGVGQGDFVYLDPPYPPLNGTSNFTRYTVNRFSQADQRRLAEVFRNLDRTGVKVMMTNADIPLIRSLYRAYPLHPLLVTRYVTCKKKRHRVTELVVTNYEVLSEEAT